MSPVPKIVGIGLVTPLGRSAHDTWNALLTGQSITDHTRLPAAVRTDLPRVTSLAIEAADEAMKHAGWGAVSDHTDTAIIIGTSKGPVETWLQTAPPGFVPSDKIAPPAGWLNLKSVTAQAGTPGIERRISHSRGPIPVLPAWAVEPNFGLASIATHIAQHSGLTDGPRVTLSAACASGLHALIRGCMMIESGEARRVLVVAAEASVHPLFLASFQRLGVLPPAGELCRPFDINRQGFLMSDAAAAVCLEASESPGIVIDRYALGGDATHLTGSKSDRALLEKMLRKVVFINTGSTRPALFPTSDNQCYVKLDDGGLDLVHAHGTGTELNDATELAALDGLAQSAKPILYSHKGALGHSLGASGLVSVVLNYLCHSLGRVPGNVNTIKPMPYSGVEIDRSPRLRDVRRSIAISSGFGGPIAVVSLRTVV